jgi:hypothetical protein
MDLVDDRASLRAVKTRFEPLISGRARGQQGRPCQVRAEII